jgi:branched-subunit amino acid transport protein
VLYHGGAVLDPSPFNPRLVGVIAAGIWLCWSRNIIGCLATGMAAYSLARLYL